MAATLSTHLDIRPARADDQSAVYALFEDHSRHLVGIVQRDARRIRRIWPAADVEQDARVVAASDGTLVGFILAQPDTHTWISACVHPAYQGQGIGTALARWVETHVREATVELPAGDRVALVQRILCANTAARTLLLAQGYRLAHTFVRMHVEMDVHPPRPTLPSGVAIRPYRQGQEERAVVYADYDAFREIEGAPPFEALYARWMRRLEADPTHDPSLWFVAVEDDEIIGVALCRSQADAGEEMGWVNRLGVRAPWRRRGIGQALLHHVFGVFYRRGKHKVGLNVDPENLTGAMHLYKKVGMHAVPELGTWQFEQVLKHQILR